MKTLKSFLKENKYKHSIASKIASLTNSNQHTEALVLLAKHIRDKKSAEVLESIIVIRNYRGHLDQNLSTIVRGIYKELLAKAKKTLRSDEYEEIHGAL